MAIQILKHGRDVHEASGDALKVRDSVDAKLCATDLLGQPEDGMTKALAWELGPAQIRVHTVCPTFMGTEFTSDMFKTPGFREWVTSKIALGRVGRVEEIIGDRLSGERCSDVDDRQRLDAGWRLDGSLT